MCLYWKYVVTIQQICSILTEPGADMKQGKRSIVLFLFFCFFLFFFFGTSEIKFRWDWLSSIEEKKRKSHLGFFKPILIRKRVVVKCRKGSVQYNYISIIWSHHFKFHAVLSILCRYFHIWILKCKTMDEKTNIKSATFFFF